MSKAIVLAGGGARGSYHIGVWQALTEMGYRYDIVTGTSVGSLNGALMALGLLDVAKAMWLSIDDRDVMDVPHKVFSVETLEFARDFALKGGISLEPLEKMIIRFVDEEKLRASHCRYGLVTVNINTRKPVEITLEDIPHGRLVDYMLASSACFPVLRSRKIDGHTYIDGGYYDNLPANLAVAMGAREIVTVDLDSFGFSRPLEDKNIKVIQIKSWHDLGNFLDFNPQNARRNMEIGYLDAYKAFGKLDGKAFGFKTGELEKMYTSFGMRLMELCEQAYENNQTLKLAAEVYMHTERKTPKKLTDKFVSVLEGAMLAGNLPLGEVYTLENLPGYIAQTKPNHIYDNAELYIKDSIKNKLLSSVGAADIKHMYLALLKTLI